MILGIDPGPTSDGLVLCETRDDGPPLPLWANAAAAHTGFTRDYITQAPEYSHVVIEVPEPRCQPLGVDLFETIMWSAHLLELYHPRVVRIEPRAIRIALCGTASASTPAIRQRMLDLCGEIGTKKKPGPLWPIREGSRKKGDHAWSAYRAVVAAWVGGRLT